jgi:hypothetical protein
MINDYKLLRMFHAVHPDFKDSRSCEVTIEEDLDGDDYGQVVSVTKDGNWCWGYTQSELLFEYITKDWEE